MKKWLYIGGGLVVVIVAAVVILWGSIDSIVKAAVERMGSQMTQTQVRLNEADIGATSGKGALRGLSVANPQGYKTETAFALGEIRLALDYASLRGDVVTIRELAIIGPQVTYEIGPGGSNIDVIRKNIDSYTRAQGGQPGSAKPTPASAPQPAPKNDEKETKLIIESLLIQGGKVTVSAPMVLQNRNPNTSLPDIKLSNLGKAKGGATPAEIVDEVMRVLEQQVLASVGKLDAGAALEAARKQGLGALQGAIPAGLPVGGAQMPSAQDAGKAAEDAAKRLLGR